MDGLIDGYMIGWMDGWMDGWMVCLYVVCMCMVGWISVCVYACMDG